MPTGSVSTIVGDGGLGALPTSSAQAHVIMGVCSAGTAGTVYAFNDLTLLSTTLVGGPAVEAAAYEMAVGGGTIYVCPITASVPGVASAVTVTRVGTSNGTITVTSGTPLDAYNVLIRVASAGLGQLVSRGTVSVNVSTDAGITYGPATLVPATGVFTLRDVKSVATGLTLAFSVADSTFDYGDVFSISCQAPVYSSGDVTTALTMLLASTLDFSWIHFVGFPTVGSSSANATASAALASTISTYMSVAQTAGQYIFAIVETPPSLDADIATAYANFFDRRVKVQVGTELVTSPLNGCNYVRSSAWGLSARLGKIRPSVSPGQTGDGGIANAPGGPLDGIYAINRDERTATTPMYDLGFGTTLTYRGYPGFFSDAGRMKAPVGSDYTLVMYRRVMDSVCRVARLAGFKYLNAPLNVDSATGYLITKDAAGIRSYIESQIRAALSTEFSDIIVTVITTDNILSTQKLRVKVQVIGFAYALNVEEIIEFLNPALTLV